jgi:hypothetical protein
MNARRRTLAAAYLEQLAAVPWVAPLATAPYLHEYAWHLMVVALEVEALTVTRDQVLAELREGGVGAGLHFVPLHLQTLYRPMVSDLSRLAIAPTRTAHPVAAVFPGWLTTTTYQSSRPVDIVRVALMVPKSVGVRRVPATARQRRALERARATRGACGTCPTSIGAGAQRRELRSLRDEVATASVVSHELVMVNDASRDGRAPFYTSWRPIRRGRVAELSRNSAASAVLAFRSRAAACSDLDADLNPSARSRAS